MASRKLIATVIVTFLSATSFIGVGSQLVDSQSSKPAEASSSINDTAYLEISSSYWGGASAYYTLHYWGGDSSSSWPGVSFNNNESASGSKVLTATWDTSSTHLIIVRWGDAAHTAEWNRWSYYDANAFTPNSINYFANDSWSNCTSYLVKEKSGDIYFSNANNWSDVFAYSYHSSHPYLTKGLGVFPGTAMNLSSDITFDSVSGLYRLTVSHLLDDTIIFNNGNFETASLNIDLETDSVYYKTDYVSTGDAVRGAAANFVYDLNTTRLAVSASGDIKDASICGISTLDATSICQNYNALSAEAKGYINASSIYTYTNQSSTSADTNISVSSIMSQLSLMSGVGLLSRITFTNSLSDNYSILLTSIICVLGTLALGGFYLLKKKKAN